MRRIGVLLTARSIFLLIFAALLALSATGCASYQADRMSRILDRFEINSATRQDVEEKLGKPHRVRVEKEFKMTTLSYYLYAHGNIQEGIGFTFDESGKLVRKGLCSTVTWD